MTVALIASAILCLLLGLICRHLWRTNQRNQSYYEARLKELTEESARRGHYLTNLLGVLNRTTGGIVKRISENIEVAEAIQTNAPDLFKKCDGLAYWLHAHDQFFGYLYAAAADGINPDQRMRIEEMYETSDGTIYERIYQAAGLPYPPIPANRPK